MGQKKRVIIGITGMPGSGKSTAIEALRSMKYPVIVMGDFIREYARKKGLEITAKTLGKVMLQMRKEEGKDIVARLTVEAIRKLSDSVAIVDGIRSPEEVEEFKRSLSNFRLIAIHAPQKVRFRRIFKRERIDDPNTWKSFLERDHRELSVGVGTVIISADIVVEADSIKELRRKIKKTLKEWLSQ
ncbi:MAG: AAA family ATPase [Candidatus Bathyarchaeota archaeon]